MTSYLESDFADFYLDGGVLYFIYKPIDTISLDIAKVITLTRLRFQQGVAFPVLCDTRAINNADKAAREYFANEGMFLAKAVSLLVKHRATMALLDFFLRVNKPIVPTTLCTTEAEALKFLKTYI